jgi:hypothetical protein
VKQLTLCSIRRATALILVSVLLAPAGMYAQAPSPSPGTTAESQTRVPPAGQRASDPKPLEADELAQLAQRAEEPGPEVAGGALSNEHLTYIVIALAAAVIVLIAK